jgi:hypothetical protein
LINQNESTTTPNESSPQHHKQLNKTTNDNKIQNLLTELSLDDQPFEGEEHEEEEEEQIQQTSLQLINNSSDQSTQLIDVDRYRIDFTTNDDDITTTTTYNTPIIKTNGDESSIDESLFKEKEKNYIKYLQEENAKFK